MNEVDRVSAAMRRHGQPDNPGFQKFARIALQTLRGEAAVELVARAFEKSANPDRDPERPVTGSHYMAGLPHWRIWIEYARPAVAAITGMK